VGQPFENWFKILTLITDYCVMVFEPFCMNCFLALEKPVGKLNGGYKTPEQHRFLTNTVMVRKKDTQSLDTFEIQTNLKTGENVCFFVLAIQKADDLKTGHRSTIQNLD
jgi:hypothetical protein